MKRSIAFAVLFGVVVPLAAAEDYLEPYRRGFNAFNWFRWELAVTEMRKAIALNPNESRDNVHIRLLTWKPYVPHFYLGISLAKLDRCSEAIPALRESLRQGMLQEGGTRFNFRNRAESTLAECLRKVPETPRTQVAVASPRPSAPADEPARESTAKPAPQIREPVRADPLPGSAALSQTAATNPPAVATTSGPLLAPVVSVTPAKDDSKARATSREALRSAIDRAQQVLLSVPKDETSREALVLREQLRRADLSTESASGLLSATGDITRATASLERWLRSRPSSGGPDEPPAALVAAVEAYLRADYAGALQLLNGAEFADDRSRGYAFLFRAAARHSLWVVGRSRDEGLQSAALADLRAFRQLRPGTALDPRLFSPRFLEFARQAGL